jgi:hypothetical protein
MHGNRFFIPSLIAIAVLPLLAQKSQTFRKTLSPQTDIQGYPCAKGYAWFYGDGHLDCCFVPREISFGEATIPAGSEIALTSDGTPEMVQMSRDTAIRGYVCAGGGWLGVAEGSMTSFYPNGSLKECFLASDQAVQGVPCSHGGFWITAFHGDPSVKFRSDGMLASCKLTQDFGSYKKGDRYSRRP